ncbi:MAG: T9SS type A sorting domain-containing protein [bacterium]
MRERLLKLLMGGIFLFITLAFPGGPDTLWTEEYGGYYAEYGYSIVQTFEGNYIVVGITESYGAGGFDIFVIKLSNDGNVVWTKTYGGPNDDIGRSVIQNTDGSYVIVGKKNNYGTTYDDVWLLKLNAMGDTLWTRCYGGNHNEIGYEVQQTSDGGYIIVGATRSFGSGVPTYTNGYLIKTDANGDTLWTRVFGDTLLVDDYGLSVKQTYDGGYIICGCSGLHPQFDLYLVKTNNNGDVLWARKYGGSGQEIGYSIIESNGNYIVAGYTNSYGPNPSNYYLLKIGQNGDTIWTKVYDGGGDEHAYSIQNTSDGGYIIAGFTWQPVYGDDFYLVKINANGDSIWTKIYPRAYHSDVPYQIQQTDDNGYIIVGYTNYWGFGKLRGYEQIYVVKTLPDVGIDEEISSSKKIFLKIRPNPVVDGAMIESYIPQKCITNIEVYNILGQKIKTITEKIENPGIYRIMWDGRDEHKNNVSQGIYFIYCNGEGKKIVKIR